MTKELKEQIKDLMNKNFHSKEEDGVMKYITYQTEEQKHIALQEEDYEEKDFKPLKVSIPLENKKIIVALNAIQNYNYGFESFVMGARESCATEDEKNKRNLAYDFIEEELSKESNIKKDLKDNIKTNQP